MPSQTTALNPHLRRGPRQKLGMPKPKRWNHQDELETAKGKDIIISFRDRTTVAGKLIAADQFTIKAQVDYQGVALEEIYFKSAMHGFRIND